jgi:hypothetical protein
LTGSSSIHGRRRTNVDDSASGAVTLQNFQIHTL